jgi:hypothetical protein
MILSFPVQTIRFSHTVHCNVITHPCEIKVNQQTLAGTNWEMTKGRSKMDGLARLKSSISWFINFKTVLL